MSSIGTHENNSFEHDYEPDTRENDYTEEEVTENEIERLNRRLNESNERTRFMKSKFQEISAILDVHSLTGIITHVELQKIKTIVEPYSK